MRWTTVWLMVAAVAAASGCVSRKPELAGDGRGGGSGSGFRPPPSTPVVMVPNTPAPPPVAPPPAVAPVKPANPDGWSGLGQKLPGAGKGEFAEERRWDPVYFAYNQSFIGASEEKKLASVAEYLKQNAKSQLRIEGHCDERGSDEYNRALGERRALAARDGGCVFPGCDAPAAWTDAHHVVRVADGGTSDANNLALLCRHHHGVVHRPDWSMRHVGDQRFQVVTPAGVTLDCQRHHRPARSRE